MYTSIWQTNDLFSISRSDILNIAGNQKSEINVNLETGETQETFSSVLADKLNGTYSESNVPYSHLAKNGVITYNGVTFVCDEMNQAICLGDMSDRKNVLSINLSGGGRLMVNRDNLDELQNAIGMFSPEDVNRILRAIADDQKAQKELLEIDEMTNSIGDDTREETFC